MGNWQSEKWICVQQQQKRLITEECACSICQKSLCAPWLLLKCFVCTVIVLETLKGTRASDTWSSSIWFSWRQDHSLLGGRESISLSTVKTGPSYTTVHQWGEDHRWVYSSSCIQFAFSLTAVLLLYWTCTLSFMQCYNMMV